MLGISFIIVVQKGLNFIFLALLFNSLSFASETYEILPPPHFFQKRIFSVNSNINQSLYPIIIRKLQDNINNYSSVEVSLFPNPSKPSINDRKQKGKTSNAVPSKNREGSFCYRSIDGRSGYCLPAFQCLHVIKEYKSHGTKIDVCTYRNSIPIICCPLSHKVSHSPRISEKKCHEYHTSLKDIKIGQQNKFSEKECVASIPLIIGGNVTQSAEYPHMAAVGWSKNNKTFWGCGGTLISEKFVLTAAHCASLQKQSPDIVRMGTIYLNSPNSQDIPIQIIILHPKYDFKTFYNDVALLKLSKSLNFMNNIQPACLWQLPDIKVSSAIATGWGYTKYKGSRSETLQKVKLNIIHQKVCKKLYREERRFPNGIGSDQFCAGQLEGGKDTCQGDSGGPLHAEVPELNCVKFIIGITSFGKSCAAPNSPGVYIKISAHLDWIEKVAFAE